MTPMEVICHKLDELGVEYDTYELPNGNHGVSWIDGNNIEWEAVQIGENFEIHALQLVTPEQAVTATVGERDYTYDEWRAINEAVGDAMEYAHEHAVMYPDKADPLWNIDEYVNRVLEVAYGDKASEQKVSAEWRNVALGLFNALEKADLEAAKRWLCENDLLRQEIAYGDAKAATVGEEHEMHICKRCGVAYELSIIDKGYGKPRFCPNCGYRRSING